MNTRGLNSGNKLNKNKHVLTNLDLDIKIIIDAHSDTTRIDNLRKGYKTRMAQYNTEGCFSKERGILILTWKATGYVILNIKLFDLPNTLQFDIR